MAVINSAGLALVESFEGCKLTAYQDGGGVWSIGYGHTGPDVHEDLTITHTQAVIFLEADLAEAEADVSRVVEIDLNPNEFSALVSFQFNTGSLPDSPGLDCINARQFVTAWDDHFCLWVHDAQGNLEEGLVRRRAAERALFFEA